MLSSLSAAGGTALSALVPVLTTLFGTLFG